MSQFQYLTKQYLIKSINEYNRALLFNRTKAKRLREEANKVLEAFANDDTDLCSDDLSDYMDAYIKTFGVIKKRRASDVAMKSFNKLNRDSYARYNFINHARRAKFLAFKSRFTHNLTSLFGRFDLTESEIQQLKSSSVIVPQSLVSQNNSNTHNDEVDVAPQNTEQKKTPRKLRLPYFSRLRGTIAACGLTILCGLGYAQFVRADNTEAREDDKNIEKSVKMKAQQKVADTVKSDTINFDAPIFSSVTSGQTKVSTASLSPQVKSKSVSPKKIQAKPKSVTSSTQTNKVKADSRDTSDHLAKIYKNYYDNTIALHLGEKGKTELYAKINKAIHQGKIKLPAGVTMERLALVMTISNQVQPFSKANKLLQEIISGDKESGDKELSAVKQQQIWQIVYEAGERGEHIKGTGSYSKYDNSSEQVKQSHNKVLQQLKAAGRLYTINHYGGK